MKHWLSLAVAASAFGIGCSSDSSQKGTAGSSTRVAGTRPSSSASGADLTGAGATFPQPIYNKWFAEYAAKNGVKINYQAIGSGGGIKQLQEQTVDFGASDAPMTDAELSAAKGGPIIHVPTVIGVVALAYNLPGLTQPLKLTGSLLADIYLGKVTKWNDTRIAALNAGVNLPANDILVVHRAEGSGTTFIFTDYLSSVSPAWKSGPGKGKEVQWPVGLGAQGSAGVTGQIKQTPNALGYTELAYAQQNKLPTALVQNKTGQFVAPSSESGSAAAAGALSRLGGNTDYRISIVNADGAQAYPITSFTWLLVYQHIKDAAKARKLADFVKWAMADGEKEAAGLGYAPLPGDLAARLSARVDSVATSASSGAK